MVTASKILKKYFCQDRDGKMRSRRTLDNRNEVFVNVGWKLNLGVNVYMTQELSLVFNTFRSNYCLNNGVRWTMKYCAMVEHSRVSEYRLKIINQVSPKWWRKYRILCTKICVPNVIWLYSSQYHNNQLSIIFILRREKIVCPVTYGHPCTWSQGTTLLLWSNSNRSLSNITSNWKNIQFLK